MGRKAKRTAAKDSTDNTATRRERHEPATAYGRGEAALFALTLFLSAALLFTVQPMFAKMVLPRLGGAPAVWNSCLVFYQAALLGGYLYAHLTLKWLGVRRQAMLHLGLLVVAWVSLPIRIAGDWLPPPTAFPAWWLWLFLAVSLGVPFFAVSANAPMLQAWFARTHSPGRRDPYFLYAASNLGSMLGLLGYPLLMEAHLTLAGQSLSWAIGFGLLTGLIAGCAVMLWRTEGNKPSPPAPLPEGEGRHASTRSDPLSAPAKEITVRRRLHWLVLSLVPSSLLMGVTTYISSELAQMPFLWVVPLALYLLTFVLVFAPWKKEGGLSRFWIHLQTVLVIVAAMSFLVSTAGIWEVVLLGLLHLVAFFVTAMVCHGQLAADRPEPARLTEFYLWMSLGGMIGGLFNVLLVPLLFSRALEYPLILAVACLLRSPQSSRHPPDAVRQKLSASEKAGETSRRPGPHGGRHAEHACYFSWHDALPAAAVLLCLVVAWGLRAGSFLSGVRYTDSLAMRIAILIVSALTALLVRRRPAVFAAAVGAVIAISLWSAETGTDVLRTSRSFFGILRVDRDTVWNTHQLYHGTTLHGQQSFDEGHRRDIQGYYHRGGPLGTIFDVLRSRRPSANVGILGLGAGAIAAYAESGQTFTFYEIDPEVERIARDPRYFTYLADCRGTKEVILGDARLSLEHDSRQFDLLIGDVFTSDAVPVHLVTREALQVYFDHLRPGGILAFHISSRYLDLEPILGRLAAAESPPRAARIRRDRQREAPPLWWMPSVWVVMARNDSDLGPLGNDPAWKPLRCDEGPAWADDFSNVLGAMKWEWHSLYILVPSSLNPANKAKSHGQRAQFLLAEGRIDEAIEHFRASLEINANDAAYHYGLAAALAAKGETEEAGFEYMETLKFEPRYAAAHFGLGVALGKLQEYDKATLAFRCAIECDPSYADAYCNLGNILLDRKEFSEAAKTYRQGIAVKPESADLHYGLGRALMLQDVVPGALVELRAALPLAEQAKNASLVEKIRAAIRRCEAWPWEEEK